MDKRLNEISFQLSGYSLGNFKKRLTISPKHDEVDAIISGINMLGEELEAVTISKNYFTNIFNSVSDMVFILNSKGIIQDVNKSAEDQLEYQTGSLIGRPITDLHKGDISYFRNILKQLKNNNPIMDHESVLHNRKGDTIPVRINVSYFNDEMKNQLIILTTSDITFQIKNGNLNIRTIIDTLEKERQRLAKDFHDSILQQLSGIKFNISTTTNLSKNKTLKKILLKSNEAMAEVITEMRNICFNLMPGTLEEFGLVKAVKELCGHFRYHNKVNFNIVQNSRLPDFSPEVKIDLYRVIQEFINNAIKHGEAKDISISFNYYKKILKVILVDNGKGFDNQKPRKGMGLQNVKSRIKSHNGKLDIISNIGKGTCYKIGIPLNL